MIRSPPLVIPSLNDIRFAPERASLVILQAALVIAARALAVEHPRCRFHVHVGFTICNALSSLRLSRARPGHWPLLSSSLRLLVSADQRTCWTYRDSL